MRLGHEMLIAWDELGAQVMCFCIHVNVFMWSPCARAPACTTLRDGDNGRECTCLQSKKCSRKVRITAIAMQQQIVVDS